METYNADKTRAGRHIQRGSGRLQFVFLLVVAFGTVATLIRLVVSSRAPTKSIPTGQTVIAGQYHGDATFEDATLSETIKRLQELRAQQRKARMELENESRLLLERLRKLQEFRGVLAELQQPTNTLAVVKDGLAEINAGLEEQIRLELQREKQYQQRQQHSEPKASVEKVENTISQVNTQRSVVPKNGIAGVTKDVPHVEGTEIHVTLPPFDYDMSFPLHGIMSSYTSQHNGFPVVLMCYNRPEELQLTLNSLLSVRGITKENILIAQDGKIQAVTDVVTRMGVKYVQRLPGFFSSAMTAKEAKDGALRIANHYKFGLTKAFEEFPDAPGVVVVEDDFRFSPDFMEYFVAIAPALEHDPSLWIASAWNDNGFRGNVKDKSAVRRTSFFPGLGWLLTRQIWGEIQPKWPASHWDWFMRDPANSKGRDCIIPEVPRDFHAGSKGTFMDAATQRQYFDTIDYNLDASFHWHGNDAAYQIMSNNYDRYMDNLIKSGYSIQSPSDLFKPLPSGYACFVVWYEADLNPAKEKLVKSFAKEFNIWHQLLRGAHEMTHILWYNNQPVVLVNTVTPSKRGKNTWFQPPKDPSKYRALRPASATVFVPNQFIMELNSVKLKDQAVDVPVTASITAATDSQIGKSCNDVCGSVGLKCDVTQLPAINTCSKLQSVFPCSSCLPSMGSDQPGMIIKDGGAPSCLQNTDRSYFSCSGSFPQTRRLCPCVK